MMYMNVAITLFFVSVIGAIVSIVVKRNQKILTPVNILIFGVFVAGAILFYPMCTERLTGENAYPGTAGLFSAFYALQLFVLGGDYTLIESYLLTQDVSYAALYALVISAAYVIAPLLTFSFILSMFKNAFSYVRYCFCFFRNTYVFSELNEKSVALAKSLKKKKGWPAIVFTDVFEREDEVSYELMDQAARIGAICFKKDIQALRFGFHFPKSNLKFFAIGTDEDENLKQSLSLMKRYGKRSNMYLYIFSNRADGEVLLSKPSCTQMTVRRVNDVRSLVYKILDDGGEKLFQNAKLSQVGEKYITAVNAGLGLHGTEMLKALTWLCQMEGYRLILHAFEKDASAQSKIMAECPELLGSAHNCVRQDGVPAYEIYIHDGIDVNSYEFVESMRAIPDVTYAFVSLGTDSENIKTAIQLRTQLLENDNMPVIEAVVYDSEKQKALENIKNFKEQEYKINFVGDLNTLYSDAVLLNSDWEKEAKARHLSYAKIEEIVEQERQFWVYEYNYRSSVASVLHKKMRLAAKLPGAEKAPAARSDKERECVQKTEHKRWAAYLRTEGYSFGAERNDLAKKHNLLVPYSQLSPKDKAKNDD